MDEKELAAFLRIWYAKQVSKIETSGASRDEKNKLIAALNY